MITVPSSDVGRVEIARLHSKRETLFFKMAGLCYLIVVIVLLTFFTIRAFKYKYLQENECYNNGWIDTVITVLTLAVILLGSALLITSLKYVFTSEEDFVGPKPVDKVEDFIRRNSQLIPTPVATITRNSSTSSNKWLNSVRSEAYESHRRMSMAPIALHKSQLNPL